MGAWVWGRVPAPVVCFSCIGQTINTLLLLACLRRARARAHTHTHTHTPTHTHTHTDTHTHTCSRCCSLDRPPNHTKTKENRTKKNAAQSTNQHTKKPTTRQVRQMSWLQKLRKDGCMPLQTLGFCTGAALTVIACLTFAAKLLDLNVVAAINQVRVCVRGKGVCVCCGSSGVSSKPACAPAAAPPAHPSIDRPHRPPCLPVCALRIPRSINQSINRPTG